MTQLAGFDVTSHAFGLLEGGAPATAYLLRHPRGIRAQVTDYGGILTSLFVPDAHGGVEDIVLGYERLEDYVADPFFIGGVIGRYANRIGGASFPLDGEAFPLARNDGPNQLHGGPRGFHKVLWSARPIALDDRVGVALFRRSAAGEEGYPGSLDVEVEYSLHRDGDLHIDYRATCDRTTVVNLTQHSYFNLALSRERDILDHELTIRAGRFTPIDGALLPTGELRDVAGTAFDFRTPRRIGAHIDDLDPQIRLAGGYDHNWVLDGPAGSLGEAARVRCAASGRELVVLTTEPGIQFYSGNALAPRAGARPGASAKTGKADAPFARRSAFCLETQHFPDSPNQPHFPSTQLRAGQTYRSTTVLRFGVFGESSSVGVSP